MVDSLASVQPLADMALAPLAERMAYKQAASKVTIDNRESSEVHPFTGQVLKFCGEHGESSRLGQQRLVQCLHSQPPQQEFERMVSVFFKHHGR